MNAPLNPLWITTVLSSSEIFQATDESFASSRGPPRQAEENQSPDNAAGSGSTVLARSVRTILVRMHQNLGISCSPSSRQQLFEEHLGTGRHVRAFTSKRSTPR